MRAVLYLVAALAAAAYHLVEGALFLGISLIVCVLLYIAARWYARKVLWPSDREPHS